MPASGEPRPLRPVESLMPAELPILYVKSGCPWCEEVIEFLSNNGVGYREKNVTDDALAFDEMRRLSKQSKAPVLDWHGTILADFGVEELKPFLLQKNVKLEDS
jgi:glutaredoxin 3